MISAAETADIRLDAADYLPDSCLIERPGTPTSDNAGGWTSTYAPLASAVPCRLAPGGLRSGETVVADRIDATNDWTVTLPALQDVTAKDRITVTVEETGAMAVLEVDQADGPRSYEWLRRVGCTGGLV